MLVSYILILTSFSTISVQMYSTMKTLFSNRAQNRRQAGNMALITIRFKSEELLFRPLKTCTNSHSLFLFISSLRKVHINLFTISG